LLEADFNVQSTRWKSADLELLPDNGNHYEIIDGELLVTRAPHWKHQKVVTRLIQSLGSWSIAHKIMENEHNCTFYDFFF
jgi:Uma2 family endonuclease